MKANNRGERGFTLVEVLVAVAIIIILAAIAFVNVISYRKSLYQLELNATAKEIYIAAQNHLTVAKAEGRLNGNSASTDPNEELPAKSDVYYYVISGGSGYTNTSSNDLDLMLPFASIDETIRSGGSYVIRYQRKTGKVLNVFYASPTGDSMTHLNGYTFVADDAKLLFGESGDEKKYIGVDNEQNRTKFRDSKVIGWYGEGSNTPIGEEIKAPKVSIINSAKLSVHIDNALNTEASGDKANSELKLVVTGRKTNAKKEYSLIKYDGTNYSIPTESQKYADIDVSKKGFTIILDDITTTSNTYAKDNDLRFHTITADTGKFEPGEDLLIEAIAFDNTKLTNIARSGTKITNSLFASIKEGSSTESGVARITSFRHLLNINPKVSYINYSTSNPNNLHIKKVEQLSTLYWTNNSSSGKGFVEEINPATDRIVRIIYDDGDDGDIKLYNNTEYLPIPQIDTELEYDGKRHAINNVKTINIKDNNKERDVGLFEFLRNGSYIHDLELKNFHVSTDDGNAGALIARIENSRIERVLVCNEKSASSDLEIYGTKAVGGLVGTINRTEAEASEKETIKECAAAVYVKSIGTDVGGLIGSVTGEKASAKVNIVKSYGGGHTSKGTYLDDMTKGQKGRVNVISAAATSQANAGGLAGNTTNCVIDHSYSTCSVKGGTEGKIGGLVGNAGSGTEIKNSYAIGYVFGGKIIKDADGNVTESYRGSFIGFLDTSAICDGNMYLSVVNEACTASVGDMTNAIGADPADIDITSYNSFAEYSVYGIAYDSKVIEMYNSIYPFKSIEKMVNLSGYPSPSSGLVKHLKTHYGDWPIVDTFVVNNKL